MQHISFVGLQINSHFSVVRIKLKHFLIYKQKIIMMIQGQKYHPWQNCCIFNHIS